MKKSAPTIHNAKYIISYYSLSKVFAKIYKTYNWQNQEVYEEYTKIHHGCYLKKWTKIFQNKKELDTYLYSIYDLKGIRYKQLYYSMATALKNDPNKNGYLIIHKIGENSNQPYVYLLRNKEKNKIQSNHSKKKRKVYYCDCFACTGTTYENKQRKIEKDIKKLINYD